MKPHRLLIPLVVALVSSAVGGAPMAARADAPCAHTDVVFYSLDSQALAQQLGTVPSACADYWISVGPYTGLTNTGKPKFLPAGPVIHAQGSQFHALAEIKLGTWCTYAATHGWYETGQMLHDWMLTEGFDTARDAWALNETGFPSGDSCATAVFTDTTTRRNVQELIHGLYDGTAGETPIAGTVFAANPAQLAAPADVAAYRQSLATWYEDTPFWQDMDRYVRFWGQETYADPRAWGVAGSSLADRRAALNDYFMHGRRLAAADDDAAARAFFAHAYTPIGNASWKQPAPVPALGPGFGETDNLTATGMKSFVSGQVDALRSWIGTRFGFAVVPKNAGTDKNPIEQQIGLAVRASESDLGGACTVFACDTLVPGAAFTDAWRSFAAPPRITSTASGDHWYTSDVTVGWNVDSMDSPIDSSTGCETAVLSTDTAGTTFTCTATNRGGTSTASVTIRRDSTPPEITPVVTGATSGDWYTGDVAISWIVSDSVSPILSTDGCDATTLTTDTTGTTFTCLAASEGGTARRSVTVQRDATPPLITCVPTPSTLWPPNGTLVPVTVDVTVTDATAGSEGFVLASAPAESAADFIVGTPDTNGLLRARRAGNGGDRTYTLTYVAHDAAGNTATCEADIVVPHDEGK